MVLYEDVAKRRVQVRVLCYLGAVLVLSVAPRHDAASLVLHGDVAKEREQVCCGGTQSHVCSEALLTLRSHAVLCRAVLCPHS